MEVWLEELKNILGFSMKKNSKQKLKILKNQVNIAMKELLMKGYIEKVKVKSSSVIEFKIKLTEKYFFDTEAFDEIMCAMEKQTGFYASFGLDNVKDGFYITLMDNVLDININLWTPSNLLSNLRPNEFVFEGVKCSSMESFLQSLKYNNTEKQKEVCMLSGEEARVKGRKKFFWKLSGNVYWKGLKFKRNSREFDNLILSAYKSLYNQSEDLRLGLSCTKDDKLVYTEGKRNKRRTILTEEEFVSCLEKIRSIEERS